MASRYARTASLHRLRYTEGSRAVEAVGPFLAIEADRFVEMRQRIGGPILPNQHLPQIVPRLRVGGVRRDRRFVLGECRHQVTRRVRRVAGALRVVAFVLRRAPRDRPRVASRR